MRGLLVLLPLLVAAPAAPAAAQDLPRDAHLRITGASLRTEITRDFVDGHAGHPDVAAAGDVNGDGFGDVVVGAPAADPAGRRDAGSAFVVFGSRTARTVDVDRLGAGGIRIDGRPPVVPVEDERGVIGEGAGAAVTGVGDVNGDGLADVAVASPAASLGESRLLSGAVHVIFGRREAGIVDLASLGGGGFRIDGPRPFDAFGQTLAGLTGELAIGGLDRIHVVPLTGAADLAAAPGAVIGGYDRGDFNPFYAGPRRLRRLDPAGDVDGDGRVDLLVGPGDSDVEGVPPDESRYDRSGFVVFAGGPAHLGSLGSRGIRIGGVVGESGTRLAAVGNVTGDRRPDVLAGRTLRSRRFWLTDARGRRLRRITTRSDDGPARVVPGRGPGHVDLGRGEPAAPRVPAAGLLAAGIGDIDGDGRGELVLGDASEDDERVRLRVIGSRALARRRATPLATLRWGARDARGAGDVDGDGRADLGLVSGDEILVVAARSLRR